MPGIFIKRPLYKHSDCISNKRNSRKAVIVPEQKGFKYSMTARLGVNRSGKIFSP